MVKVEWVKIMFFFVFFSLSFLLPLSHKRVSQLIGKVTLSKTYETVCLALPDGSFGRVFHCLFVKSLNLSFSSLLLSLKSRKKSGCHVQDRCLFASCEISLRYITRYMFHISSLRSQLVVQW